MLTLYFYTTNRKTQDQQNEKEREIDNITRTIVP